MNRIISILIYVILFLVIVSVASAIDLETNLTHGYTFDDANLTGSNPDDVVDFSQNGTTTGATTGDDGILGESFSYDGTDDKVVFDTATIIETNTFTITMWVSNYTDDGTLEHLFGSAEGTSTDGIVFVVDGTGNLLDWALTDGGVGGYQCIVQNSTMFTTLADGGWHFIMGSYNTTHCSLSLDGGAKHIVAQVAAPVDGGNLQIGERPDGSWDFNGNIDELFIWTRELTNAEIYEVFISGNPLPVVVVPQIDLLFANTTGDFKILFDEREDFNVYVNWTLDNGTILDNSTGNRNCSIGIIDGLVEIQGDFDNFTLCDSGCNFSNRSKEFDFETIVNAVNDSIHFEGCHEQTASGNIDINFSCSNVSEIVTVLASEMPLCDSGIAFIRKTSDVCIGSTLLNISTDTAGNIPFSQRKRILNSASDREYSIDINSYDSLVFFNDTLDMWQTSHTHIFHKEGNKEIHGNCTDSDDSSNDLNVTENITIVNLPPQIFIDQVETSLGIINLSEGVEIEFADGIWSWLISVVDDDLEFVNYSWFNSSGVLLFNFTASGTPESINTSSDLFVDFEGNPFNLSVFANDTFGDSTNVSLTFNVNDTDFPEITFNYPLGDNTTIIRSNFSDFDIIVTDENLYSIYLNVTDCLTTTHFNFSNISLNGLTSFNFIQEINLTSLDDGIYCTLVESCDGHTRKSLKDYKIELDMKDYTITYNDEIVIKSIMPLTKFESYKLDDRYNFEIITSSSVDYLEFRVYSFNFIDILDSDYTAHLVIGKYWVDFETNGLLKSDVVRISDNEVLVKLWFNKERDIFIFSSIGELNCEISTASFTLNRESLNPFLFSSIDITLEQGVFLFLLFVIGGGLLIYAEIIFSISLIMLAGIYYLLYGIFMLFLSPQFAFIIMFVGILIMIRGLELRLSFYGGR